MWLNKPKQTTNKRKTSIDPMGIFGRSESEEMFQKQAQIIY